MSVQMCVCAPVPHKMVEGCIVKENSGRIPAASPVHVSMFTAEVHNSCIDVYYMYVNVCLCVKFMLKYVTNKHYSYVLQLCIISISMLHHNLLAASPHSLPGCEGGGGWSSWTEGVCTRTPKRGRIREDRRTCTTPNHPDCCHGDAVRVVPCPEGGMMIN